MMSNEHQHAALRDRMSPFVFSLREKLQSCGCDCAWSPFETSVRSIEIAANANIREGASLQ